MKVIPAILPHSFEEVTEKCSRVEGLTSFIQIDICDGVFGREKTWMPTGMEVMPSGFAFEFDLMLTNWKDTVLHCLTLGAKSIVAHVDNFSDEDIAALVGMVAPHSISLGIAVSNDKELDFHADMFRKTRDLYPHVFIQVMGIAKIGEQGQIFDESTPGRIVSLKKLFGDALVQVDGGMMPETVKRVVSEGAENVVVGSYIFGGEDAGGAIERLEVVSA